MPAFHFQCEGTKILTCITLKDLCDLMKLRPGVDAADMEGPDPSRDSELFAEHLH